MQKIKEGYTNTSFRDNDRFVQVKKLNGWNHNIDYTIFKDLDFIPKLISNTEKEVVWEYIENKKNIWDQYTISQIAINFKKLHDSKISLPPKNLAARYDNYRKIIKNKNLDILEVNNYKDVVNEILEMYPDSWPVHNDLYGSNVMTGVDNKIYFVDWEYATMGNKNWDLAFVVVATLFNEEQEQWLLQAYQDYDLEAYNRFKIVVAYFIVIWAYSLDQMPIDIEAWKQRLTNLVNKYWKK
ncbi:phosphotransferase family protein [Mycoplasma sp. 128]